MLLYSSDATARLSGLRAGSVPGAGSSGESSLPALLRKDKNKKRDAIMLFADRFYCQLQAQMSSSSDPEDLPSLWTAPKGP